MLSPVASTLIKHALAQALLVVVATTAYAQQLGFDKVFAPNPIDAGGTSTLTFTIDNTGNQFDVTSLDFTDNLPAAVVVAAVPNASTTCTGGTLTAVAGSGTIAYTGGTVAALSACTVSVDTTSSTPGSHVNTSGDLTYIESSAGTATDTLTVNAPTPPAFDKVFAPDPIDAGGTSTLTFTIDNTANGIATTDLDFTDSLPAAIVVATVPNASTTCTGGTLTAVSGSGTITYTGGTVAASSTCTVSVDTTSDTSGSHVNTSGDLTSSAGNSGTATDTLSVNAPTQPAFDKIFAPNPIDEGGTSTLTFTVDNTANAVATTALDFTDNLPAAVVVAAVPNASTTCTGGTLTAVAGGGTITYTGGTVAASSTCTISVDATSDAPGSHVNTSGDLTSSAGNSGTATDTLTVNAVLTPPGFSKSFAPNPIDAGGTSTLTFTIDSTANSVATTALDFTDSLPAVVVVAAAPNASTTCTGGTLTAAAGGGTITYTGGTVAASSTCTISVDTTSDAAGSHVNTSGDLTSSAGNSGPATDTLTVTAAPVPALGFWWLVMLGGLLGLIALWQLQVRP